MEKQGSGHPNPQEHQYKFGPKALYGITGKVGSGKSGLLGVILEEIPFYSGKLKKTGTIAYVEQEPIIFSNTIRENILFGLPFEEHKYKDALERSCLISDLDLLEEGD